MNKQKVAKVLSIAGSDSGGCAGIQADLRVLNALGCHGSTAITAITAQNTLTVTEILPLTPAMIIHQVEAIMADIGADAIKIGMLFNVEIIEAVSQICQKYSHIPIVVDPVCVATSGATLLEFRAVQALLTKLIPLATVITPNQYEAALLISNSSNQVTTSNPAQQLRCQACLVTNGDSSSISVSDELYLLTNDEPISFTHPKINTTNNHGSGCSLSTAISAYLAQGFSIKAAVGHAIDFIQLGIQGGRSRMVGHGAGPLHFQ